MERHLLDPIGSMTASDTVQRLGAVLSMDESLAELSVRTRSVDSQPGDLAKAVADGTVIQSYLFRGALHYLTPDDGAMYLALRSAGRQWELPSWVEHYGLAAADWPNFRAAVRDALGDASLTVTELGEVLARQPAYRHLKPTFDAGAGTLVKPLTWQGDISLGPRRDGHLTLHRLDRNPAWRGLPELDEAGPRAVISYFRTYGPATLHHLHYWLGEGLSAGRKRIAAWFAGLDAQLVAVDVEGTVAHVAGEDVDGLTAAVPSEEVRLLPGHDQWVIGPGTGDAHVTPAELRDAMTRKANPVIHGGVVRGTWVRRAHALEVTWRGEKPPPTSSLERESERLSRAVGQDLQLRLSR
ncbi:MAG: winged helix DNA-binding domain-containing protein [Actinobacteria bacterium]|nr:winged helix DNA-binding domain-containing protein [Actinomycetota bacterium]